MENGITEKYIYKNLPTVKKLEILFKKMEHLSIKDREPYDCEIDKLLMNSSNRVHSLLSH